MTEHYEVTFQDEERLKSPSYRRMESLYEFTSSIISAILFVAIILVFFFRMATVKGTSMVPTLADQDKLLITGISQNYEYGDIVVIHREGDDSLVKRVIATSGDKIDIDFENGIVYINDKALDEPYIAEPTYRSFYDGPNFPFTVPDGFLFCMGDNRNNSLDSRSGEVGLINVQYIVGKMIVDISNTEAK